MTGGYSTEVTPDTIPNSAVKLCSVDGTACRLWESRSPPVFFFARIPKRSTGFFFGEFWKIEHLWIKVEFLCRGWKGFRPQIERIPQIFYFYIEDCVGSMQNGKDFRPQIERIPRIFYFFIDGCVDSMQGMKGFRWQIQRIRWIFFIFLLMVV